MYRYELGSSDKFFFLFVQKNGWYVTKIFAVCFSNFLARLKLILIFGIAEWVTKISAMFKTYQSRLKD